MSRLAKLTVSAMALLGMVIADAQADELPVLYVSVTGNDASPGTEAQPLRTGLEAVRRGKAGEMTTIVFRQGEYRESLGGIFKPVTLRSYPGEQAWFKGSTEVPATRFAADGPVWRLDDWNPPDVCDPGPAGDACVFPPDINDDNPLGGDPAMVFVDGQQLRQVAARGDVTAGTFFRDVPNRRLYLGTDPAGRRIEIAARNFAVHLFAGAENSEIRGLGFAHYATSQDYRKRPAAVIVQARGVVAADNTIADNAAAGLLANGDDMRVTGNLFTRNGFNAANAHKIKNLTLTGNRMLTNNGERFGVDKGNSLAGAGMKATHLHESTVRDNVFEGNQGTGFWCDLSCHKVSMVRNLARANTKHGLYYEVSSHALIASNVLAGNGRFGLKISGSNHIRTYNNTMVGNKQAIQVAEDPRPTCPGDADHCPSDADRALGITWDTADVSLVNNLFAGGPDPVFDTVDGNSAASGKRVGADGMIPAAAMDYNGHYRTAPGTLVNWTRITGADVQYKTLQAFQATSRDTHGRFQEGGAVYFVDAPGGDYRVIPGSPAAAAGSPLPTDIAEAVGVPAGGPVSLGALRWPGDAPPDSLTKPVYRLHHPTVGATLLTLSQSEADNAVAHYGYVSDGVGFRAASAASAEVVPVYRLWHNKTGDRLFTASATERDNAVQRYGYASEGIGFYAGKASPGLTPVHRLQKGALHRYAVGDAERAAAVAEGWNYEHIAFHGR
nr:right-handed parallel beta-helix repeat-containing protein [Kibdelosporangium sp. MJ126-NF4]CEL18154.1 hypothetical protein [Kibdelosporangium sp. MJ126-NF4]CTQ90616.1 hypothetical protein [Kibdelosporangium sp. MJ126-NF4]